jgi:outer membrane protein assembly factor BamB
LISARRFPETGKENNVMMLRKNRWRLGKAGLLLMLMLTVILAASGCVQGLQPIGWSGGDVADGILFVGSREGRVVSVDTANEERLWAEPLKAAGGSGGLFGCSATSLYGGGCAGGAAGVAIYGTPAVNDGRVYVAGYNGKVYSYFTETLQTDEVYPVDEHLEPIVGGVVVAEGNIYFGCSDGKVYALDAENFQKKWEAPFETGDKIWATPAYGDGVVYIGSFDKKLYALDAATGGKLWEYTTDGAVISTPLVHEGTVYCGSFDKNLYALNAADGSLKWQFTGENWFWARPAVHGDKIYAGCLDGNVYVLQVDNGAMVAALDLGSPVSAAPVAYNSSIIFASREGAVYSVDTVRNELRHLADVEGEVYGPLAVYQGVVYVHTQDLTLHRINAESGAVLRPVSLESSD